MVTLVARDINSRGGSPWTDVPFLKEDNLFADLVQGLVLMSQLNSILYHKIKLNCTPNLLMSQEEEDI